MLHLFNYPNKITLANIPTPIQKLRFRESQFLIKRDDFTGLELSGNKVRKLEFLLYQAKKQNADLLFTCGGEQSNHARATVFAAKSIGLNTKLFLWGRESENADGNLFLNRILNTEIKYLNKSEYDNVNSIMSEEKIKLEKSGKNIFIISEGGSTEVGVWGYVKAFEEIITKSSLNINSILTASGSGGTSAGLLLGSLLYGKKIKIFAVNVLYPADVIKNRILNLVENTIKKYKLKLNLDESLLEVLDGYSNEGYKNISSEKVKVIKECAMQTGVLFDPVYTGKAFYAYQEQFMSGKKLSKTLFIHTGGLFGLFSKRKLFLQNL
jgi:D-cysteine desulfhydrase